MSAGKYEALATSVGRLVDEKSKAYGDSAGKTAEIFRAFYPNGIPVESYSTVLLMARMMDKFARLATDPTYGGEEPWKDLVGYALIGCDQSQLAAAPIPDSDPKGSTSGDATTAAKPEKMSEREEALAGGKAKRDNGLYLGRCNIEDGGLLCTRLPGHPGDHIASGLISICGRWPAAAPAAESEKAAACPFVCILFPRGVQSCALPTGHPGDHQTKEGSTWKHTGPTPSLPPKWDLKAKRWSSCPQCRAPWVWGNQGSALNAPTYFSYACPDCATSAWASKDVSALIRRAAELMGPA